MNAFNVDPANINQEVAKLALDFVYLGIATIVVAYGILHQCQEVLTIICF